MQLCKKANTAKQRCENKTSVHGAITIANATFIALMKEKFTDLAINDTEIQCAFELMFEKVGIVNHILSKRGMRNLNKAAIVNDV